MKFTLDGKAVGSAVTTTAGVATLTGVATALAPGTDSGGVVATFAGDSTDNSTTTTGNLVVSQAATTVAGVSGISSFGGTATLTATLTSQSPTCRSPARPSPSRSAATRPAPPSRTPAG